jgi:hypothetical protein
MMPSIIMAATANSPRSRAISPSSAVAVAALNRRDTEDRDVERAWSCTALPTGSDTAW